MVVHRRWTGAEHSSSAHRAQTLAQGPGLVVKGTRVGSGRCVLVLGPSVWRTRGQDRDARRTKSHSYHHLIPHPLSRLWAPRFCAGLPLQFQILVHHRKRRARHTSVGSGEMELGRLHVTPHSHRLWHRQHRLWSGDGTLSKVCARPLTSAPDGMVPLWVRVHNNVSCEPENHATPNRPAQHADGRGGGLLM